MKTKVVFRKWISGAGIIALFPQIPSDIHGHYCQSYEHVGQHGAASPDLGHITQPATPDEYRGLQNELERLGYDLDIRTRITAKDTAMRYAAARKPDLEPVA